MSFLVKHAQANTQPTSYADDASYRVLDNGVLEIIDPAKGKRYLVASAAWAWIEEAWGETESTGVSFV